MTNPKRASAGSFDPVDSTPTVRRILAGFLGWPLLVAFFLSSMVIGALVVHGGPAMRVSYTYSGTPERRLDHQCTYWTLEGMREVRPAAGLNQCEFFTLLPMDIFAGFQK